MKHASDGDMQGGRAEAKVGTPLLRYAGRQVSMHSAGQEKRRSETAEQARLAERRTGVAREMQVVLEVEVEVKVWMNDEAEAVPVPVKVTVKQAR